jgi:hypothetical protein
VTTNFFQREPALYNDSHLSGRDLDITRIPRGEDSTHEHCGLPFAGQKIFPSDPLYQIQFNPHSEELSCITLPQVLEPNIPDRSWLLLEPEQPASFHAVEAPKPSLASQSPLAFNSLSQNFYPVSDSLSPVLSIPHYTSVSGSLGSLHQLDISLPAVENFVLIDKSHLHSERNSSRRTCRSSEHDRSGSTSSSPASTSSTSPNGVKCTWTSCNKVFRTRSEYKYVSYSLP